MIRWVRSSIGLGVVLVALALSLGLQGLPAMATHEEESRFLDGFSQVQGGAGEGIAQLNGEIFPHSLWLSDDCDDADFVEFNLGRDWTRLSTTLGLEDNDSESGAKMVFEIFEDGELSWSRVVSFGESVAVDIDVTNTLRLRLQATDICDELSSIGIYGSAAVARPKAHGHVRTISLTLTERGKAKGTMSVNDDFKECAQGVVVKIERKKYSYDDWSTVARATTNSEGEFTARLSKKSGKFRALAPQFEIGATYPEHICFKAKSNAITY